MKDDYRGEKWGLDSSGKKQREEKRLIAGREGNKEVFVTGQRRKRG